MREGTAADDPSGGTLTAPRPRPGILLDRDGTIIMDHGYVGSVARVEFIEGAAEAIAKFNQAGVPVAVVTNQAGVARGLYGLDDVAAVHRHIAERLAEHGAHIDMFVFCPYHPDGVIEAFRVERAPAFALALQWHPEWQATGNEFSRALFAEFGAACRSRS